MTTNFQLLMQSQNLLKFQILIMVGVGVWKGLVITNFQLLMVSPNLLKFQSPMMVMVGEGEGEVRGVSNF